MILDVYTENDRYWLCKDIGECLSIEPSSKDICSNFKRLSVDDGKHPHPMKPPNDIEISNEKQTSGFGNETSLKRGDICGIQSDSCLISHHIPQKHWGSGEYSCLNRDDQDVGDTISVFSLLDSKCDAMNLDFDDLIVNQNCFQNSSEISKVSFMTEKRLKEECNQHQFWFCKNHEQCIHPNLVCNRETNCDDGSDENRSLCNKTISLKCDIYDGRSMLCLESATPFDTICASRCDGIEECLGGPDESNCESTLMRVANCETDYQYVRKLIIAIASSTIILTTLVVSLFWKKTVSVFIDGEKDVIKKRDLELKESRHTATQILSIIQNGDISEGKLEEVKNLIESLHSFGIYTNELSILAGFGAKSHQRKKSKVLLKCLYDSEVSIHRNDWKDAEECMKTNIGTNSLCQCVLDSHYPSGLEKILSFLRLPTYLQNKVVDFIEFWKKQTQLSNVIRCMAILRIIVYYIDLVKDIFLLIAISVAANIPNRFFDDFTVQLIIAYSLSIIIPLIINWANIAFYNLEEACGSFDEIFSTRKRRYLQFLTLVFIPFMPGILLYQTSKKYEKICSVNRKIKHELEKGQNADTKNVLDLSEKSLNLTKEERKLKNIFIMYTKSELIEVLFQSCITILLVSMKDSGFSLTADPLEGICGGIDWLLPTSLFLSLKKGLSVSVKVQEMNKDGFQQFLGMILYGLFALVAFMTRLISIVTYFAVPLGLYNLLAHYQYESRGFSWNDTNIYYFENLDYLDKTEIRYTTEKVYSGNTTIPITKYTGLPMQTYYVIFLLGMVFHFLLMLLKRSKESSQIQNQPTTKNSEITETPSFLRAFTSFVIPEVSYDWDEYKTMNHSPEDHKDVIEVSDCFNDFSF